jgi:hypothetical protein
MSYEHEVFRRRCFIVGAKSPFSISRQLELAARHCLFFARWSNDNSPSKRVKGPCSASGTHIGESRDAVNYWAVANHLRSVNRTVLRFS